MDTIRKLSRLGDDLHLNAGVAVAALIPGHLEPAVVLVLLLRQCVDDWIGGCRFRRPEKPIRSTSINAIATSLHRPYATIHRHVMYLIDQGWAMWLGKGVAVSNHSGIEQPIVDLMTLAHDSIIGLAEDLGSDVIFPAPGVRPTGELRRRTLMTALDVWLVHHEYAREPVTDWTSKLVWIVIVVANVRHITVDPVLSEQYARNPTPDAMRRPINARAISRISGLSYGTVFRHCQKLSEQDVIRYDRGGWLLVSRQLSNRQVDQGVKALLDYYNKRISELVAYGFDPAAAAAFYLNGRPARVPIDPPR